VTQLFVATIRTGDGPVPAVVRDGMVAPIAGAMSVRAMLEDWDGWLARLDEDPEELDGAADPDELADAGDVADLEDLTNEA